MMTKTLLLLVFWLATHCESSPQFIGGKVLITPLCGIVPADVNTDVHPCGFTKSELDKIYGTYRVVLKSVTQQILKEQVLDATGTFSFSVKEGEYIIDVISDNPTGNPPTGMAQKVTVGKNQKIKIDLVVNTGIR